MKHFQRKISLLVIGSFGYLFAESAGYDPAMFMGLAAMQNSREISQLPFKDSAAVGVKLGAISCISDATKGVFARALGTSIDQGHGALSAWYKTFMTKLRGAQGFEVRDLFGWKWVLERSVNTHISNVAKGARVVRAHVLDQEKKNNETVDAPYGVGALKRDIEYIIGNLQERVKHYDVDLTKKRKHTIFDRVLDGAAVTGLGYLGLNWLWAPISKENAEILSKKCCEQSAELQQSKFLMQEKALGIEFALRRNERDLGIERAKSVSLDLSAWDKQIEHENKKAEYYAKLANQKELTTKDRLIGLGIKAGIVLFALYRAGHWLKSQDAVAFAATLSDVNRSMIIHLTKTLINYLERLAQLCADIKEESDIARLKDDFEFISKNCGETFVHIARIIDQKEALELQRLGKPGQASASFGQGSGGVLGGGLPRF